MRLIIPIPLPCPVPPSCALSLHVFQRGFLPHLPRPTHSTPCSSPPSSTLPLSLASCLPPDLPLCFLSGAAGSVTKRRLYYRIFCSLFWSRLGLPVGALRLGVPHGRALLRHQSFHVYFMSFSFACHARTHGSPSPFHPPPAIHPSSSHALPSCWYYSDVVASWLILT